MVTFRNNNSSRRTNFRRNDRSFKTNGDRQKFSSSFANNENFKRKVPGRNNHNAPKLIEKYNDLAREALSNGDKILSESYLQHADHFTRILNDQENMKKTKFMESKKVSSDPKSSDLKDNTSNTIVENSVKETKNVDEVSETIKDQPEVN